MKIKENRFFRFFVCVLIFSTGIFAGTGAGIILGNPTGISFKISKTQKKAFAFASGWSRNSFYLHGDALFYRNDFINWEEGNVLFYWGGGLRVKFADETKIGFRIPLGLDYKFDEEPLNVFFEIVPVLVLVPETDFSLDAAIGIRYLFTSP